jgi:hypothetical protein
VEDSPAVPTDRRSLMFAAVALAALLYLLAAEARLGYDTAYQLVWGRELLDGGLPDYDVRLAPTPHPLQVLVAAPLSLLGQGADEGMRCVSLLSFAALGLAIGRIGALMFSRPVGMLAAAVLLTRPHLIELAYLGDADVPAAALVAWAAAVALGGAREPAPRRDATVLGLLVLAGLLRPEPWLLSLAYLAWIGRGRSPRGLAPLAALAAAGPLLWALSDLAVTGDALWSLHHTRTDTELLERDTGARAAVEQLPRHLNFLLGTQVLVVALLGLAAGLLIARRRMWGLVTVLVIAGGGFLVLALAGLSLQPRYLTGLAAAVTVCAGIGGLGWLVTRDARWRIAGIAGLVLLAAGLPFDAAELADVRSRVVDDGRRLEQLARGDARAALRDCGPVAVPTIRPIPYLALWADTDPERFTESAAATGAFVTPTETSESWAGGGGEGQPPRVLPPLPPGYAEVAANDAWRVYATC